MSGVLVLNQSKDKSQVPYQQYFDEVANISTTPVKRSLGLGRSYVEISYLAGNGAAPTGKFLYVVLNAVTDADAAVKLTVVGVRLVIPLGGVLKIQAVGKITRIDLVSDTAETGTSKTFITSGA